MTKRAALGVLWAAATATAALLAASWMLVGGDRRPLLIGKTTGAHHQIETACETCHAAPPFADAAEATRALNATCRNCHRDELQAAADSHPARLFRNPRMAAYWQRLDVRQCTTCHVEHRPETTREGAVSVAADFCAACHSEGDQDVRQARPSHAGLPFDSCASAGCHNYHDNRALYEDFLARHAGQPWLAPAAVHPLAARSRAQKPLPEAPSAAHAALAPPAALQEEAAVRNWSASGHATAGVGCVACHAPTAPHGASRTVVEALWIPAPDTAACRDCHEAQASTFAAGRHGMRRHPRIAPPRDASDALEAIGLAGLSSKAASGWLRDPPRARRMTVAEARLPMRAEAADEALDCATCHRPHAVDTAPAAAEACAACHDDRHSRSYFGSAHHALWLAELAGTAPPGTGVSCATCHMAKAERRGEVTTSHNQSATLRPNEKMIRPVCLHCHGLRFAIDALADANLAISNFRGQPAVQVESVDWALRRRSDR